jgi:hypothetical protein
LGVRIPAGAGNFSLITASRPALGPTQSPIQWVTETLPLGVKRPKREADHSPPSSAEVKKAWSYVSTRNTPSWRDAQLKGGRETVKFTELKVEDKYPILRVRNAKTSVIFRNIDLYEMAI